MWQITMNWMLNWVLQHTNLHTCKCILALQKLAKTFISIFVLTSVFVFNHTKLVLPLVSLSPDQGYGFMYVFLPDPTPHCRNYQYHSIFSLCSTSVITLIHMLAARESLVAIKGLLQS